MRARDIKPGFYLNEQLAECSPWARLIFPGLWMLADREGRLEYRPKRIKAELLPYDGEDMASLISELEAQGLVKRYTVDGEEYLWIPTFSRHQSPHPKEKPSVIPPHSDQGVTKDIPGSHLGDTQVEPRDDQGVTKDIPNPSSYLSPSSLSPREDSTLTSFECLSSPDGDDAPTSSPTGQEERQEPSIQQASPCPQVSPPPCPYEKIRDMYHAVFPEHPRVALLNVKRKGAVKARWGDAGQRLRALERPDSAAERLAYFQRLFSKAAESDFLTGKRAFRDGSVYRVDFDKLMSPGGFVGVIEGKYDNRPEG